MTRIFLLGPNKWPKDTTDPKAGQKIREAIVADNQDLDADWVIMENDKTPGDNVHKFLAIAPKCTHFPAMAT